MLWQEEEEQAAEGEGAGAGKGEDVRHQVHTIGDCKLRSLLIHFKKLLEEQSLFWIYHYKVKSVPPVWYKLLMLTLLTEYLKGVLSKNLQKPYICGR